MITLLVLAIAAAIWLSRRGRALDLRWRIAGWTAVAAAVALGAALAPPLVILRKLIGVLFLPATLVWLAIAALLIRARREPRWRWPLLGLLVGYTLAGSPWTCYLLLRSLERPFEHLRPLDAVTPYDAVFVMGGGSSSLPNGDPLSPELGQAGDRIRLAAVLYRRGLTPVLVTSGMTPDGKHDLTVEHAALWAALGIPEEAVVRGPLGRNSVEEITGLARLARERGWTHLGLVTSARHLPRALALCRRYGVTVDPLPADFRAEIPTPGLWGVLPSGEAFAGVESAVWEYLGIAAVHLVGG